MVYLPNRNTSMFNSTFLKRKNDGNRTNTHTGNDLVKLHHHASPFSSYIYANSTNAYTHHAVDSIRIFRRIFYPSATKGFFFSLFLQPVAVSKMGVHLSTSL